MQKPPFMLAPLMSFGAFMAFSLVPTANAQASSVALSCAINSCQATVSSPASPQPFTYSWSFTGTAHFVSPIGNCNGRLLSHGSTCLFKCAQPYSDHIVVNVNVADADGGFIGSASAAAICDGSSSGP